MTTSPLQPVDSAISGRSIRPDRYPRRGLAALVLTIGSLALLSSFRAPSELAILAPMESLPPARSTTGASTSATAIPAGQGSAGSGGPGTGDSGTGDPGSRATAAGAGRVTGRDPASATQAQRVVTGQTVRTPYGPVQVQVTLTGRMITDVQALQLPYDRSYSAEISQAVEPMLREEALRVQHGRMRLVSGATYTSKGYARSLQSALDQAG